MGGSNSPLNVRHWVIRTITNCFLFSFVCWLWGIGVFLKLEKMTGFNPTAFPNPPKKIATCLKNVSAHSVAVS